MKDELTPEQEKAYIRIHGQERLDLVRRCDFWRAGWLKVYSRDFLGGKPNVHYTRQRYARAATRHYNSLPKYQPLI